MQIHLIAFAILLTINITTFLAFRRDKQAARSGERRTPERQLLWLAVFGGSLGALAAQQILRHKTRKQPFRSILIGIALVHIALVAVWIFVPA
ncbi:DUF1294 domain-containing protein [Pararhizobium sp.]|uniref:DUF1294 domain-containing protein n=1 Tax=Pararhizobium sp. TaxID=1977563 RepID=UPI0027251E33|nr:DUF1294 domain-containing protein [Pararhizobium sp.]MDO9415879.1 DUF1294 domain-containing protein [Pararhizobium sp.]